MAVDLKVIGTGFGRTGTDSMRDALDLLGFGPCHHMRELLRDSVQKQEWRRLAVSAVPDWSRVLGGYRSCVDWPSAHYWPQLADTFPEAKVILTWRSAESWWRSFEQTILPRLLADTETEETAPGSQLISLRVFGGRPLTREHCLAVYEANVAAVRARIAPDRLLVFELGEGWDKLCRFLGTPVPATAFPHRNTASDFQAFTAERTEGTARPA